MAMPMTPEEISAEWLSSILGHKVQSFTITSTILNETTGKVFVDPVYEDGAANKDRPAHLCLKGSFNPTMANMRGYAELLYMAYSQEVEFFARVAPKLPTEVLRLPQVWWAGASHEQMQGICAMEDLNRRPSISYCEPAEAATLSEAMACVEQLAALHAATWDYSRERDFPSAGGYETVMLGLTLAWDAMALNPARPSIPEAYRDQARTTAAIKKHFATRNPRFLCLVHGDSHVGNLFIDNDGPAFLDWQFASVGSAFHNPGRREHEDAVLDHYLATLAQLGGPKLDRNDEKVYQEYRKCLISGMGWVLTPTQMQRRERVEAMVERYAAAFEDHKVIELIESLPTPSRSSSSSSLSSS
ncbi:kinase-like domain-containing protein [Apiospora saccharicola]|uniref:Kinase-like domain-containing protein n=1 Tax=Apiospora saccharicola TaxID=335842 RepID=A0ABR1UZA3_9PEZI